MSDELNVSKFFGSFVELVPWVKTIRYAAGIAILLFVVFTIYRAYFMPTSSNKQTITIGKGGVANITQQTDAKKHWDTFVEPYIQLNTKGEWVGGLRCGLRF